MLKRKRIRNAQDRMKQQGIDAYLILTHDDYIYFFGEDRYQPRAIIPAEGVPIVVTFAGEEDEVKASLGVEDVRIFGSVGQQIKDVVQVMRGMIGEKEKLTIGVQMWFSTPAFLLNMFQRANPIVYVVDIAPVMDELRMVKDASEIALMQRAAEIAGIGMETAVKTLRFGITENEVAAEVEYAMRKAGGHGVATPVFVNSEIRSGWLHGTASDKVIENGDLVVLDLVPRYKGYCEINGISRFGLEKILKFDIFWFVILWYLSLHTLAEKLVKDTSFSVVILIAGFCEIQGRVSC